jgi:hypothetical protein
MSDTPPPAIDPDQLHLDLVAATAAMKLQAESTAALASVIAPVTPHIPALIEMAGAWTAGKAVAGTVRGFEGFLGRMSKLVIAIAILIAAYKLDFKGLLGFSH